MEFEKIDKLLCDLPHVSSKQGRIILYDFILKESLVLK